MTQRSRSWFITVNSDLDNAREVLKGLMTTGVYGVIGPNERGHKTEHEHFHGYVYFKSQRTMSSVLKKCKPHCPHLDVAKGTALEAMRYCCKGEHTKEECAIDESLCVEPVFECGEAPKAGRRTDLEEVIKCETLAEVMDVHPETYCRYRGGLKDIYAKREGTRTMVELFAEVEKNVLVKPKVYWVTGESGSGKTYYSYKLAMELGYTGLTAGCVSFDNNGFASGENMDAECLIFNEFRDSRMRLDDFLKMTDAYGYSLNVKGGQTKIRPKCLIFNSVWSLRDIYANACNGSTESRKQIYRRITKVVVMNKWVPSTYDMSDDMSDDRWDDELDIDA